jgi:hypothetical protein
MNEIAEAFQRVLAHIMRTDDDQSPYWVPYGCGEPYHWDNEQMTEDRAILSKLIDQKAPWPA